MDVADNIDLLTILQVRSTADPLTRWWEPKASRIRRRGLAEPVPVRAQLIGNPPPAPQEFEDYYEMRFQVRAAATSAHFAAPALPYHTLQAVPSLSSARGSAFAAGRRARALRRRAARQQAGRVAAETRGKELPAAAAAFPAAGCFSRFTPPRSAPSIPPIVSRHISPYVPAVVGAGSSRAQPPLPPPPPPCTHTHESRPAAPPRPARRGAQRKPKLTRRVGGEPRAGDPAKLPTISKPARPRKPANADAPAAAAARPAGPGRPPAHPSRQPGSGRTAAAAGARPLSAGGQDAAAGGGGGGGIGGALTCVKVSDEGLLKFPILPILKCRFSKRRF